MRYIALLAVVLSASPCFAAQSHLLTEIHLSWPIDQVGNPFRIRTTLDHYIEFATTSSPLSIDFEIGANDKPNVAAFASDLTDGNQDIILMSVGTFNHRLFERWAFGEFDVVDSTGLRRLDYATRDFPAQVTGIDWSGFQLDHFRVTAIGPISDTLPDRARVVFQVFGVVPEPSTALLFVLGVASTTPRLRRHWR